MFIDDQHRIDAECGIVETCEACGCEHQDKTALCAHCDWLFFLDSVSVVDEPLNIELEVI